MGVYIKGWKIPFSCGACSFREYIGEHMRPFCMYLQERITGEEYGGRLTDCPLIPIHDHGDLIDRDELMKHGVYMPMSGGNLPLVYMSYIKGAKAVIPAERREE